MAESCIKYNDVLLRICSRKIFSILKHKLGRDEAAAVMREIKKEYRIVLNQFPDVGKNTLTDMAYLGAMFIAIWTGTGKRFYADELDDIYTQIVKHFKCILGLVNLNKAYAKKKLEQEIDNYLVWLNKEGSSYPGRWDAYKDSAVDKGVKFIFTKCPVHEYCIAHDCLHILPAICHQDRFMCEMMHGVLKREQTLATGDCCDFWIFGDEE